MKRSRSAFRLTPEEIALIVLAGDCCADGLEWSRKFGHDPAQWPHRTALIRTNIPYTHIQYMTWDKKHGWLRW